MSQGREPLFQMHKRGYISFGKLALIHLIALLLALLACAAVIVLVTGVNPLGVYEALVSGAVGNPRRLWVTIRESGVLLLIAVGLTPGLSHALLEYRRGGTDTGRRHCERGTHDTARRQDSECAAPCPS